jgi:hypothetical protein
LLSGNGCTDNKFKGVIISIHPRIRLTRSFDEASHTYLGYAIKITGTIENQQTTFSIGIGKAAQAKFNFKVNNVISGECAVTAKLKWTESNK